ncbi:MAG: fatty acid desaturase [Myxococcales bacterium]|nr:fatty acid desaturase [Myxococcales bacterium]
MVPVLGSAGFFFLFLPTAILGGLHVIHFNWCTHNGFSKAEDFRPVNLDHGIYWFGNRIFFGIYYHANHHYRPSAFNPAKMKPGLPLEAPTR